jgi:hypothetical protein
MSRPPVSLQTRLVAASAVLAVLVIGVFVALIVAASAARTATNDEGKSVNHTLGFAHLGGATLDNEENYLIKKLFTALGAVQIENQARI